MYPTLHTCTSVHGYIEPSGPAVQGLCVMKLKEYYEIIGEGRPLSGFFNTHADCCYRNAFIIMKLSKIPSFRMIRAVIASQSMFEK